MWGWSKRATTSASPVKSDAEIASAAATVNVDGDHAMETVAHVLRTIGRDPLDGDNEATRDACEAWSQHVLLGRPPPERTLNQGTAKRSGKREWGALRHYFSDLRRRESERVGKTNNDLRDFIWSFVQQLNRTVTEDEKGDAKAHVQLERLRRAAGDMPLEVLKQEVFATIHAVGQVLNERSERHRNEAASLSEEMRALSAELVEARRQGAEDPLTQLNNRRALDAHLAQTMAMRNLFGEPACLLMIDIDHFKKINDTYGHPGGDAVLKKLAHVLAINFPRRSDCVARFGGEEFAIVLRDASAKEARSLAERLLVAVRNLQVPHEEAVIALTISVGVTEIGKGEQAEVCVARADKALYDAKHGGRNRAVVEMLDPAKNT